MSFDQPRQPAGTPVGGRFATAARTETGLSLTTDPEVVTAGATALLGHEPDGGPAAMAALQASETVLRAAESHLEARLGRLPQQRAPHQHEPWQVKDHGAGPFCGACGEDVTPAEVFSPERFGPRLTSRLGAVPAAGGTPAAADMTALLEAPAQGPVTSWQAAEFTILSEANLEATVLAARRDAVMLDRPQTIDHPAGGVWKRTTIFPNGERSETVTLAPYKSALDWVAATVPGDQLAAATTVVMDHPDRDAHTVAAMAAEEVDPQFRPHVQSLLAQMVNQNLVGRDGIAADVLLRLPVTTPGVAALRARFDTARRARRDAAARFAARLGG